MALGITLGVVLLGVLGLIAAGFLIQALASIVDLFVNGRNQ